MHNRIVQVVTQMEAGGAQTVALLLHRELRSRGYDAELWFLYPKTRTWISEPGVHLICNRRPTLFEIPRMLYSLILNMRRTKPHAVIAHTHYANVIALPLAKLCGSPTRLAVHHNRISTYPWVAQQMELACKRLGTCTESIAVSQDVQQSLLERSTKFYRGTTRCVYNGIGSQTPEVPRPTHDESSVLSGRVLFNVGRLAEQKNQMALIELLSELPDCTVVIAGRGPLESALQQKAERLGVASQLRLLGEIEPAVVTEWMQRADLFVFPSKFEAMPMALLEAMRSGMTIVASDIPAHREVAGDAAFLTATDPLSLSQAIRVALQEKDSGNRMGLLAKKRSLRFTVDAMTDGYLESL